MLMPSSCFSLLFGIILLFPLSFEFLGGAQSEEAELPCLGGLRTGGGEGYSSISAFFFFDHHIRLKKKAKQKVGSSIYITKYLININDFVSTILYTPANAVQWMRMRQTEW